MDQAGDDAFLTRRISVGGRRLVIRAPAGDDALRRYARGRAFRDYKTLCQGILDDRSVVLDVGANIGLTTLVAAEVAHRGTVIAVEGAPRNFAALRRNIAEHAPIAARAFHSAVGAQEGEVEFVDNSTFGHVASDATMVTVPAGTVRLRTIDDLVLEAGLTRLDLIKLDIEGFEFDALEGAERTLERFDPVVFLEFNSWCQIVLYDRSPRRFLEWLMARFPQLHLWQDRTLVSVHDMGAVRFLQTNMIEHRCNDDLVAARSSKRLARLQRADAQAPGWRGLIAKLRG